MLGAALAERVSDRRMLKLIMGWLKAGVLAGETLLHPQAGTPQGGVASPLLANVVLHRLDRAWQAQHRRLGVLVRYCTLCRRRHKQHKERNVTDHLPEAERPLVQRRLRAAWALADADKATAELEQLAAALTTSGRVPPRPCARAWPRP
ncbi:MAG TPA: hypothetical protein VFA46_18270 [Actinomycetes bacterium]|nr:hypothetical protein [Actinomycetes bacterium]